MLLLHLDIADSGRAAFWAEAPEAAGEAPKPVRTTELLRTVRSVVWYEDGFEDAGGGRVVPSLPNLLMFLSDVRGRRFREGVFLAPDVLAAAELFRSAAAAVASGLYLPTLVEEDGSFFARWRPLGGASPFGGAPVPGAQLTPPPGGAPAPGAQAFMARCVDGLVRRARRTALEDDSGRHETVHDAWLAALRGETGRVDWPDVADLRDFAATLATWHAPLAVSSADRAALRFSLVPPDCEDGPWRLELAASPTTRLGLVSLGQAAAVFPPLRSLRGGVAEIGRADAENFLRTGAQALSAAGFDVRRPEGVTGEHLTAEAELAPAPEGKAGRGESVETRTVSAKLTVRVDGEKVTEREIQFLLDQGSTLVFFRDRWIEVDRYVLRDALRALQSVKAKKLKVNEAVSFALGLGRVGRLRVDRVKAHGWLRGLVNELRGEERFAVLPPPKGLAATLRDYQLRGFSWLAFLAKWGFGPCLADDMGLGKTVQAIAWILHHRNSLNSDTRTREHAHASSSPVLVVAPVSVTTNWVREFRRFAPGLRVLLHQGSGRASGGFLQRDCAQADVVVTGYSLLVRDFPALSTIQFSALVLDEAQTIKNPDTRVSRAARALDVPVKVALTGTPFENSANDLWSLEEFLNPGLLGARADFEESFTRAIRDDARSGAAAKLKRILEPFMLRRLKTDPGVAAELGEKREVREYCPLAPAQRRRYEDALAAFRADAGAEGASRGRILALLTELKLVCDGEGKLARLDELLAEIFANGESCLVFTQYAKVGRMIRAHLQETTGRLFPFLHGGLTPAQREAEIAAFDADPEPNAFILSLKAGGFGLNLTRATHVIHFDRWWNPAVENQATDRAHRIGQTKTVFVHAFICAGTLEDHIDELLESKRYLANEVVAGGESFLLKMDGRELDRVLSLDPDGPSDGATDRPSGRSAGESVKGDGQ